MKTGRADYDQRIRDRSTPAEEPRFILRAQDAAGAATVRAWAVFAQAAGAPAAVVEQALQQADAMDAWEGPKKAADADHLTEGEQSQLEYEHGRRAWNARPLDGAPSPEVLLAERRGHDQALSRLRAEVRLEAEGLARRLVLVRTALSRVLKVRPVNGEDDDDPEQRDAWRAADEALRLTEASDA